MRKSTIPDALLVNLVVDDEPGLREMKFARRCAEARQLFKDFLQPRNAGPLSQNSPTIGVKGQDDVKAVIKFAQTSAGQRLILSYAEMPIGTPFVEEVQPKRRKNLDEGIGGFAVDLTQDDDETPNNELVEIDD